MDIEEVQFVRDDRMVLVGPDAKARVGDVRILYESDLGRALAGAWDRYIQLESQLPYDQTRQRGEA